MSEESLQPQLGNQAMPLQSISVFDQSGHQRSQVNHSLPQEGQITEEKNKVLEKKGHRKQEKIMVSPERKSMRIRQIFKKVDYKISESLSLEVPQHQLNKKKVEVKQMRQKRKNQNIALHDKSNRTKKRVKKRYADLGQTETRQLVHEIHEVVFAINENGQLEPAMICRSKKEGTIKVQFIGTNIKKSLPPQSIHEFSEKNKDIYRQNEASNQLAQGQRKRRLEIAQRKVKLFRQKKEIQKVESKKSEAEIEHEREQLEQKMAEIAIKEGITVPELSKEMSSKLQRKAKRQIQRNRLKDLLNGVKKETQQPQRESKDSIHPEDKLQYSLQDMEKSIPPELKQPIRYEQGSPTEMKQNFIGFRLTSQRKHLEKVLTGEQSQNQFAYNNALPQSTTFNQKDSHTAILFFDNYAIDDESYAENRRSSESSQYLGYEKYHELKASAGKQVASYLSDYEGVSVQLSNTVQQIRNMNSVSISIIADQIVSNMKRSLQEESQNFEPKNSDKRHGYYTDVLTYIFKKKLLTVEVLTYSKLIVKCVLFVWNYESFKAQLLNNKSNLICQYELIRRMVKEWSMNYERQSRHLDLNEEGRKGRQNNLLKLNFFRQKCDTHI